MSAIAWEPPVCIVVNAAAGRRDGPAVARGAQAALAARGIEAPIRVAGRDAPVDAVARDALRDGVRTVVAIGGDGTISAVAGALAGTRATLVVLATGTFNYFARGLGLPARPEAALAACVDGCVREVSVGEVNGRVFLGSASIGLYPRVLAVRRRLYRRWGRSRVAGYVSVLAVLLGRRAPMRLSIASDAERVALDASLLFVTRSALQVEAFGLDGRERVARGELALFASRATTRTGLALLALRLLVGVLRPGKDLVALFASEADADVPGRELRVAVDGERVTMRPPLRFRVRPGALRVLVPRAAAGEMSETGDAHDPALV